MIDQIVFINSHTSGNVHNETIAGRDHLITKMNSIVGDSVMNSILYPNEEVIATMDQLDMIKAPVGHPRVNGTNVSINHPVGDNIHNVGAFIRSPRMVGKTVVNDLCIDVERANQSDKGIEVMRRINAGEAVGVSTGLTLQVENSEGVGGDGVTYTRIGRNFRFDHVALLLDEAAAGAHVGTAVVNADGGEMIVNELDVLTLEDTIDGLLRAEVGDNESAWSTQIFADSKTFIYRIRRNGENVRLFKRGYSVGPGDVVTLLGEQTEVVRRVDFVPVSGNPPAAINSETPEMVKTVKGENIADDAGKAAEATKNDNANGLTVNDVMKGAELHDLTVVNKADAEMLAHYKANKPTLDALVSQHNSQLDVKRKAVAENMGLDDDQAKSLTEDVINHQYARIVPAQDHSLQTGAALNSSAEKQKFDAINYDELESENGHK